MIPAEDGSSGPPWLLWTFPGVLHGWHQWAVQVWLRAMCHLCGQLSPVMQGADALPCEQAAAAVSSHLCSRVLPCWRPHQVQTKGAYSGWLISEKEERSDTS